MAKILMGRITGWSKVDSHIGPRIRGFIAGHPHLQDGHEILTSPIVKISEDGTEVETEHSIYKLGLAN
jgi:hypothetical protein